MTIISSGLLLLLYVVPSGSLLIKNQPCKIEVTRPVKCLQTCVQPPPASSAHHHRCLARVFTTRSVSSLIVWTRGGKPRREIQSNLFPAQSPRRKEKQSPKLQEHNTLLAPLPTPAPHSHWRQGHSQTLNS